jgi:AraC family transcriptional regulator, transcriptional activator of the genes for pyochelin and ferripyochelin receptors
MNPADYMLHRMTLHSQEHGQITCEPMPPDAPVPSLFEDEEDALSMHATGPFGRMRFHELKTDHYSLRHSLYSPEENTAMQVSLEEPFLAMHFNLKNNIHYRFSDFPGIFPKVPMLKYQYNLMYAPHVNTAFNLLKGHEYSNFTVHFTPFYLERFMMAIPQVGDFVKKIENNVPAVLSPDNLWSTPDLRALIHGLINCTFLGMQKKMYMEIKMHEMLLIAFQNISGVMYKPGLALRQSDLDKLHQARQYIIHNLDNPGTLVDIAHKVGMNDFKLKQGFKLLYGTTVFGLVHEERMQKALMLLRDTTMSILDISMLTGYKNPSNFTAAFRKRFGYPPSDLKIPNC